MNWDDEAATWEDNAQVHAYAELAYSSLEREVAQRRVPVETVLDFGCGSGVLTAMLSKRAQRVVAMDTSTEMLKQVTAKNLANVETVNSLESLTDKFSVIVASSVLSFVDDAGATVARLSRLLAPGGLFVHWDWEASGEGGEGAEGFGFSQPQCLAFLTNARLEHVRVSPAFSLSVEGSSMAVIVGSGLRPRA